MIQNSVLGGRRSGFCPSSRTYPLPFDESSGITSGHSTNGEPAAFLCLPILPICGIRSESTEKCVPHTGLQITVAVQGSC